MTVEYLREQYLAALFSQPLLRGNAIVVLAGEDWKPRIELATELYAGHDGDITHVVLSGGVHDGTRIYGAKQLKGKIMGKGVAPSRIILEDESQNTHEQAVNVVALAKKREWRRILLVASAYHMPRAWLTFLKATLEAGIADSLQIVPAPTSHTPWGGSPSGMDDSRLNLLTKELMKIEAYRGMGHVASYEDALRYFEDWESRDRPVGSAA